MSDRRIFHPQEFAVEVEQATDAWKAELLAWVGEVGRLQEIGHRLVDENAVLRKENAALRCALELAEGADR